MIYQLFHDYAKIALIPVIINTVVAVVTLIAYLFVVGSSIGTEGYEYNDALCDGNTTRFASYPSISLNFTGRFSL